MTEFREERFVADYPVPVVDVPTDRHATVQGPVGRREEPTRPEVAAAGGHTGAMIALVPSAEHVDRLAVEGGEPAEELHLTVMYLGEAADISEDIRAAIYSVAAAYAASTPVIEADGFAVNAFNPHTEDRETALVMGVGGQPLADLHAGVDGGVRKLMTPPDNHAPWVPHITFKYSDDLGEIPGLVDKLGPVTFDRLRVAMGDEVTDYPLTGDGEAVVTAAPGAHFHTLMHTEGVSTGRRVQMPGSWTWRTPPIAFNWERRTAMHGGTPEVVQVGLVTDITRMGREIHGWGMLDLNDPVALDYARKLAAGWVRGVSVGADEQPMNMELIYSPSDPETVIQEVYHSGNIYEVTSSDGVAQATAYVEPLPALLEALAERGIEVAAVEKPRKPRPTKRRRVAETAGAGDDCGCSAVS